MSEFIGNKLIFISMFCLTTFISVYFYYKYTGGYGGRMPGFNDNFKIRYFSLDDLVLVPPKIATKNQKAYLLSELIFAAVISLLFLFILIW